MQANVLAAGPSAAYYRPMPPKLYFGPYQTPRYRMGAVVHCERFGDVQIVGTSSGRIPWPLGRRVGKRGHASLVLYADLAKAVRQETGQAVRYWWGCGQVAINAMRRALSVPHLNAGNQKRIAEIQQLPAVKAGRRKAWAKARDPERRRKIAQAKKGQARPADVVAGMRDRMLGSKLSQSTRAKMSEAHRKRGTRPPWLDEAWSAAEETLVRTLPAAEVAKRTGRSLSAVYNRRNILKVPDGRGRARG
jgi:hypothetical protein